MQRARSRRRKSRRERGMRKAQRHRRDRPAEQGKESTVNGEQARMD